MEIERKLKLGFLLAFVVMAIAAIVPFQLASWTQTLQGELKQSQHEIELLERTLSLLKDAETGQRGFVITGKEEFLDPYHNALVNLRAVRVALEDEKKELFASPQTYDALNKFLSLKLEELARTIAIRRAGGFAAVEPIVTAASGKQYMDEIRKIIENEIVKKNVHRTVVHSDLEKRASTAANLGLAATLFNIALLAATAIILFRLMNERKKVTYELRESSERLNDGLTELSKRHAEISLIGQMARALEAPISSKETTDIICNYCSKLLPHTSGVLYLFRNSRDLLIKEGQWGSPLCTEEVLEPKDCWALRRGQPHKVREMGDLMCPHCQTMPLHPHGTFCLPLMAQGEVLGLIYIESLASEQPTNQSLNQHEEELAITVSEQVALGLSNVKLREVLHQQSIIDPLTGLFNRRYMDETLRRELARAARKSVPLSIILLDIDHFKSVNDTYGHDAGDVVLRSIAHSIQAVVRDSDVVCRFGGEEFVLLLSECDKEAALKRAEKVLVDMRLLDVWHGTQQIGRVTASIGISTFPEDGADIESLFQAADQAMYTAKNTGRDRIVCSSSDLIERRDFGK